METKKNKFYLTLAISLGDGWIQTGKNPSKARLSTAHAERHLDYIKYKEVLLQSIGQITQVSTKRTKSGSSSCKLNVLYTRFNKLNRSVQRQLYKEGRKRFQKRWIKHLDSLALSILWMDDGCICCQKKTKKDGTTYHYYYGDIATQAFDYESCINIQVWLKTQFSIESRLTKSRGNYTLRLSKPNLYSLIDIVKPFVNMVSSMSYKVKVDN